MSRGFRDVVAELEAMEPEERARIRHRYEVRRRPVAFVIVARADHIRAQALPLIRAGAYGEACEALKAADRHLALADLKADEDEEPES